MASNATKNRTYVLDTSVLLADPGALKRFAEHEVVLPVVVITELEGKRHHPELGYFARAALRMLYEMRVTHGRLDEPVGDHAAADDDERRRGRGCAVCSGHGSTFRSGCCGDEFALLRACYVFLRDGCLLR